MTVLATRPDRPGADPSALGGRGADRALRTLAVTLLGTLLGLAVGVGGWASLPAASTSTGSLSLTGLFGVDRGNLIEVGGQARLQTGTAAAIAGSTAVSAAAERSLGLKAGSLAGRIDAEQVRGSQIVTVAVTEPDPDAAQRASRAVIRAARDEITARGTPNPGQPRYAVTVLDPGGSPINAKAAAMPLYLVLGALAGGALGALVLALWRLRGPTGTALAAVSFPRWDVDGALRAETAEWRSKLRRRQVQLVVAATLLLLVAHAATGSVVPVALLGLASLVLGLRDLRWPAAGFIILALGAPDPRIGLIDLGVFALAVQDVVIFGGMVLVWRNHRRRTGRGRSGPPSPFTPVVVGFTAVIGFGLLVGYAGGASKAALAEPLRSMVLLPMTFVLLRAAFRGRPAQLLLGLLVHGAVASTMVVLAAPLGWAALASDARNQVTTGSTTSDVVRLSTPVLPLWSLLLIVVAAGLGVPGRRRLWLLLAAPGVLHVALSFNRSTWVPLVVLVVAAASLRGGVPGLLRRAAVVVVGGAMVGSIALLGALGPTAGDVAARAQSAVTGAATKEDSLADRLHENQVALETLRDHPLLGVGFGRPYGGTFVEYEPIGGVTVVVDRPFIHNQYLRVWLLMGVPGLVVMAWLVVRLLTVVRVLASWSTRRSAVPIAVALGVACTGLQGIFQTNLVDRPTMVLTGACLALLELYLIGGRRDAVPDRPLTDLSARRSETMRELQ